MVASFARNVEKWELLMNQQTVHRSVNEQRQNFQSVRTYDKLVVFCTYMFGNCTA